MAGEASTGREAFEMVDHLKPDIVTVDVTLPDGDGILATREILRRQPNTRVLMLTMHGNHYYVSQALSRGSQGLRAQRAAPHRDHRCPASRGQRRNLRGPAAPPGLAAPSHGPQGNGATTPLDTLSPRERDIFDLIVRGYTNTAMAETLQLSVKTIETHRAHINKKLRVHSTGELIRLAALHGLVAT